jgi:hypothetical protein
MRGYVNVFSGEFFEFRGSTVQIQGAYQVRVHHELFPTIPFSDLELSVSEHSTQAVHTQVKEVGCEMEGRPGQCLNVRFPS